MRGSGNRDDEAAAAGAVLGLLRQDLVGEVPGQQQHVVGLVLEQPLGRQDRQPAARHVAALLVRIAVDHVLEGLAAEAAVAEQRRALGGGAVGGDPPALGLEPAQQRAQLLAQAPRPLGEAAVAARDRSRPRGLLGSSSRRTAGCTACAPADIEAQRAAVDRRAAARR